MYCWVFPLLLAGIACVYLVFKVGLFHLGRFSLNPVTQSKSRPAFTIEKAGLSALIRRVLSPVAHSNPLPLSSDYGTD
jgi:hypothetical protein